MEESSNMDTVPLLTPTMETELLQEPWTFPQSKMSQIKEEERTASSIWEENFQDLSGWCMETFQAHCEFPAGESPAFKLSGTKYEGSSALTSEEGVLKDLIGVADEERWNVRMNSPETANYFTSGSHSSQTTPKVTAGRSAEEDSTTDSTTSSNWLKLPRGATASSTSPSSWNKQITTTVDKPSSFQARQEVEEIDLDDPCPTSIDSENQQETWDVLRTVETTGSDAFDLLSYLCDDEMRSPEGSVSTDSSVVSKPWSTADSSRTISQPYGRGEAENAKAVTEESSKSQVTSTATSSSSASSSSSMETAIVASRKSRRLRSSTEKTYHKVEKSYNRIARREKPPRRRCTDASEDRTFTVHYRESREKNNEASRKSRMNKKAKESEMSTKATQLERDNRILKMKVEELEKLVTSMRSALLKSAMNKEF